MGIESEVVPSWVKLRAGTYYEPTRFDNGQAAARAHGTFGMEAKLLEWTVFGLWDPETWWRFQGAVDAARRYLNWSVSVGVWH